jgi:hypothetical protein
MFRVHVNLVRSRWKFRNFRGIVPMFWPQVPFPVLPLRPNFVTRPLSVLDNSRGVGFHLPFNTLELVMVRKVESLCMRG